MSTGHIRSPIYRLENSREGNALYIMREDLIPFSFGGNKARKGMLFREDFRRRNADCLVTYGSSSSNHCRVIANLAAADRIPCRIVSASDEPSATDAPYNLRMMREFGATIVFCDVSRVRDTIEGELASLRAEGRRPYFIPGGGHGRIGVQAYVDCYREILLYQQEERLRFDYIFHASGTGTTQAGLICGKLLTGGETEIVGISIARRNPYGRNVVRDSVREYLGDAFPEEAIDANVVFEDAYVGSGYGRGQDGVRDLVWRIMERYGVPLDTVYTGKAFLGMEDYLSQRGIQGRNILFIHTGGTPLFFDDFR